LSVYNFEMAFDTYNQFAMVHKIAFKKNVALKVRLLCVNY
jgi:hypothetical protein